MTKIKNLPQNVINKLMEKLNLNVINQYEQSLIPRQYYSNSHRQTNKNKKQHPNPHTVINTGQLVFYKNGPYQKKWNMGIINQLRHPTLGNYNNAPLINSLSSSFDALINVPDVAAVSFI